MPIQEIDGPAIIILYASQAGTSKDFAEDIQASATNYGFATKIRALDSAAESVPKNQTVVIITPSYKGMPTGNTKECVSWLEANTDSETLEGISYAVYGVGNSYWTITYYRILKLIDQLFEKMESGRFVETGHVDIKTDIVEPWED
ncbi:flavo protein [Lepidopterella palustris CBS 459.81]|uniref:Flavo protein n=1 Tax=Lepidopterella palustris CBS 459.81 TaxID=1314670 RepID=A0A8E2EL11_9PEZI|nr:flavo protein [Lepidopterella palustris CBS 459.81]